jgi:hypothetical protein
MGVGVNREMSAYVIPINEEGQALLARNPNVEFAHELLLWRLTKHHGPTADRTEFLGRVAPTLPAGLRRITWKAAELAWTPAPPVPH